MIKLSYIKSDNRKYNIERCLSLIKTEITRGLKDAKNVVIKPDCIVVDNQLAATHVDTLDTLLAFISPFVKGQITLAGSSNFGDTTDAYKNYDYYKLQDYYDLAILDLNKEDFVDFTFGDSSSPWTGKVSKILLDSDYIISVCPPKTHQTLLYTGVLNNIINSSIHRPAKVQTGFFRFKNIPNDRELAYSDKKAAINNIGLLRSKFRIGLSVIDGFEVMESKGPIDGQLAAGHFSIAGTEADDVDILTCRCLGIGPDQIGYLKSSWKWNDYFVIGDDWQKNIMQIQLPKPHSTEK